MRRELGRGPRGGKESEEGGAREGGWHSAPMGIGASGKNVQNLTK